MITVTDMAGMPPSEMAEALSHIAQHLRPSDREELEATESGLTAEEAVNACIVSSTAGYLIKDRSGEPIGIFGAAPTALPQVGMVWMLGTPGIEREALSIARLTRPYFDSLNEAYPVLWNFIYRHNHGTMKWLKWGGFDVLGDYPKNPDFIIFARTTLCATPYQ